MDPMTIVVCVLMVMLGYGIGLVERSILNHMNKMLERENSLLQQQVDLLRGDNSEKSVDVSGICVKE